MTADCRIFVLLKIFLNKDHKNGQRLSYFSKVKKKLGKMHVVKHHTQWHWHGTLWTADFYTLYAAHSMPETRAYFFISQAT